MVLGLKAKIRRGPTVQLDYLIHVQEIKPWPPSQSLKNIRSVLIQWENGKRSSGTTNTVVPSVNDGQIQFNESFKLSVTLSRDMSIKNGDIDVFHKNLLEFNLFEPRRDTTVKGQLLGTANVDLSDYGILNEITSINVPVNCTRSFRNTIQPVLYIRIQPVDKGRSSSSSRGSLGKEASLDKNGRESASKLMKDYVEEAEVASFTDDDASSHSSHTASSNGGRSSQNDEKQNNGTSVHKAKSIQRRNSNSSRASSLDLSSEPGSPHNLPASIPNATGVGPKLAPENIISHGVQSSTSFDNGSSQGIKKTAGNQEGRENSQQEPHIATTMDGKLNFANDNGEPQSDEENEEKSFKTGRSAAWYRTTSEADDLDDKDGDYVEQNGGLRLIMEEKRNSFGESSNRFSQHPIRNQALSASDILLTGDLQKPVKSVWPSVESARTNGSIGVNSTITGRRDARVYPLEKRSISSDSKIEELEQRIQMLEGELREAAAIEVSLYSVVAEHGSSVSKVHAPARRLSRLYLRASRDKSNLRRASAARSAVSGLAVVSKACGNDVPRLTFWLSNCVVLRAIITEIFVEQLSSVSAGHSANRNGLWNVTNKKSPKLMWKASSSGKKGSDSSTYETLDDWSDPGAFTSALQKVESWIFLRIVESVWWQTLTPHMQSSAAKVVDKSMDSASKKSTRRMSSSSGQDQVNLSLELWKKAFKDACERLCPVRASGHECGCLSVLAKLIMEQCVARLDVAMFNAILRESADDIPTDPLSDPISDALVLPIPSGKSSFGAGAQLKNAIGNWSRILTDLFGMDDDEPFVDENEDRDDDDDGEKQFDSSFKSFHLLKSLSDLMMLPKDMLLNSSVRKEVCPTFSPHLIRRILNNFVQDEFCPDPIPDALFEALDSEEAVENDEGPMMHFPCKAAAAVYSPPSASSLAAVIGDLGSPADLRRSRSLLKKSNTSDDELDELDSPLSLIADGNLQRSPAQSRQMWNGQENDCQNGIRYQLLREIWTTSD